MAGGPIQLWNEWAIQILLLLSFTLQGVLFVFAGTRRRGSSTVVTILLWLAYLMADSTAVYTLGHLSISGSSGKEKLVVFWAPFLLVHLGSQDTITAYALEDNQLWPRHLLTLGVQASGVAYVLYNRITELPTSLGRAAVLMFIVGLIKYGERIWALRSARLDCIRSSFNHPQDFTIHSALHSPELGTDDDGLLLMAHVMLPICKGAMVDQPVSLSERFGNMHEASFCHLDLNWKDRCRVVEIELSLMYDVLYTKAAVIYTWYGYISRLAWPLTTIAAFLLFQLSGSKYGYSRVDVAITYILLVGAFLLDMASLFRALGSTWTCTFLLTRGWSQLGHAIMSLRRHVKATGGNLGWSGSIGQFNLLQFCSRRQHIVRYFHIPSGVELALSKRLYTETLVISKDVKEMVFQHVWQVLKEARDAQSKYKIKKPSILLQRDYNFGRPAVLRFESESWADTSRRRMALDEALGSGAELQEAILTCHILTDVFLLCSGTKDAASSLTYVEGIKALSDYMVFLVAMHSDTILGLELRSLYETTLKDLERLWFVKKHRSSYSAPTNERLASIMRNEGFGTVNSLFCKDTVSVVVLSRGTLYAKLLLDLVDVSNSDKFGVISSYKNHAAMGKLKRLLPDLESSCRDGMFDMPKALALIFDAWVRLLISVSVRRSRDAHAGQINRGSELTTIVWLMVEHDALFL